MRALRTTLAVAGMLGIAPVLAGAQVTPAQMLDLRPRMAHAAVDYDTLTDPEAIEACRVERVHEGNKVIGYTLIDGQGRLLRRYIATEGRQWSYYKDGFEVYREIDHDGNQTIDESRWMNAAGTRVARIERGQVAAWQRLSAEEASKVLVQALLRNDLGLLETVMAQPGELEALGLPRGLIDEVRQAQAQRSEQVAELRNALVGWTDQTVWQRFDGTMPHVIPADAAAGLADDLILYETAVVFVGLPDGQGDLSKFAYLQVPEMIRIGATWKFVELPRAIDPNNPNIIVRDGGVRSWVYRQQDDAALVGDPQLEEALRALADYDTGNAEKLASGKPDDLARYYRDRIPLLRQAVKLIADEEQKLLYNQQIVDSLASAYQTGLFPAGLDLLHKMIDEGGPIGAYAAFRTITAEAAVAMEDPGGNLLAIQKKMLEDLEDFLAQYPDSAEAADARFQVASISEFNGEEDKAREHYETLARQFPDTEPGRKAAGAVRRLDLVGKSLELKGPSLRGEPVDLARYKGKTVLVVFWATWAEPATRDLPELVKLYQQYRARGFEVVGVSLDHEKAEVEAYLQANRLPWPQIFEDGGLDSPSAVAFGIISVPTMFLVADDGQVINRNLRSVAEVERQLESQFGEPADDVALERTR